MKSDLLMDVVRSIDRRTFNRERQQRGLLVGILPEDWWRVSAAIHAAVEWSEFVRDGDVKKAAAYEKFCGLVERGLLK